MTPEAASHVDVTMRDFSRSLIRYAHCRSRALPAKRGRCQILALEVVHMRSPSRDAAVLIEIVAIQIASLRVHMKKKFPQFISVGLGVATGTLIYTRFLGAAHEFDWGRAAFVGIFCATIAFIWPSKKN